MSHRKTHNRRGKSSRFSGSTMRLLDRISAGLGRSYLESQAHKAAMKRSAHRSLGEVVIVRRKAING